MSIQPQESRIPQWTLGDRMAKAMRAESIGVQEMAEYLGVARNTITTWTHDKIRPSRQTLMLWALRTGVPLEWLTDGDGPQLPRLDSNQQPSDLQFAPTILADWRERKHA